MEQNLISDLVRMLRRVRFNCYNWSWCSIDEDLKLFLELEFQISHELQNGLKKHWDKVFVIV